MTPLLQLGRKKKGSKTSLGDALGPNLSFLDVIQDACRRGGRFTLTVESKGLTYTVLVDRGGPFNVSGGGLGGSAALATAASLRTGTFTISEGWPVDQPVYQLGLDSTLKNLLLGSPRTEEPKLPPTRGVDSIRNAAWNGESVFASTTRVSPIAPRPSPSKSATAPRRPAPTPPARSLPAPAPQALIPVAFKPAPPTAARPTTAPPSPAPTPSLPVRPPGLPPTAAVTQAPTPEAVAAEPVAAETVAVEPVAAEPASIGITIAADEPMGSIRDLALSDDIQLDAADPGEPGASESQGAMVHLVTQALLWTLQVEEPGRYTLQQAWVLTGRGLREGLAVFSDPIEREVLQRWHRAREDWRKSGQAAAKQKPRRRTIPRD